MQWFSVKKYQPTQYSVCLLCRLERQSGYWFLILGEYDDGNG